MERLDRPPSVSVNIDSDEAIARQLHEMEMETAAQAARQSEPLALPSTRLFCVTRRALNWAYFVYLILELAVMIPVMILSANERFVCEHSNLRVWILLWESRVLLALPMVVVKLRKRRRRSFAFDFANAMLSVYILVLFFWGNLLLFGPGASRCYGKSPISLAFVIAVISILYAYLAVPVIALILVCVCLPVYFLASSVIKPGSDRRESDPIDMASLQTRKFTKMAETEGEDPKCAICMNSFVPDVSTVTTLPCGHEFDRECIEYWLSIKKQCAICRRDIGESLRLEIDSQPAS